MNSKLAKGTICIVTMYILWMFDLTTQQQLGPSEQPEAFFNGSSYIRLETTVSLKRHTSFSFRSCAGGELFSQQRNDYLIELSVNPEDVLFRVRTPEKYYEARIPGNFLNNRWHVVHLIYKLGNLTLTVDKESQLLANSTYNSELLTSPELYDDEAILIVGNHYNGCILEGPSIAFNSSVIHPHNVIFGTCLIPMNSCVPREDFKESRAIDYCTTEPCMRHGSCQNGQNSYTCICMPRYSGKNCEIDLGNLCDKDPNLCKNGGTCHENNGNYNCNCLPGFEGRYCEQKVSINPLCTPNPCINNGVCRPHPSSRIECICSPGFTGPNCETNINECQPNPCLNNAVCKDGNNSYSCDCSHTGYSGKNCEINDNECQTNPCRNHGTCFDTYGGYVCQCSPGFDGKNCQYNVYECISQPCLNDGQCIDKLGSYECHCQPGFTGENCELEVHQTVCTHPNCSADIICINNPCLNGGTCSPSMGSYNCTCAAGFTGPACERLELCQWNTCGNGGICREDIFSYRCDCLEGFKGSDCSQQVQCLDDPCKHSITCKDFISGYYCTCEPGWTGLNCEINMDNCVNEPCLNGGTCIDLLDTFKCQCAHGFTGRHCQIDVDECLSNPCLNGGLCIDIQNGYYCNCTEQWVGPNCDRTYNICETKPCFNNGTCISSSNKREFTCECLKGFEGYDCKTNTDDCLGINCPNGQVCTDLIAEYECRCSAGYVGENCTTLVDPCIITPCANDGTCILDPSTHNYTCICKPGFEGPTCDKDIDECLVQSTICKHGICVNKPGGYQCYCMPGYTGENCEVDFDECLSMPCQNSGTCLNKINNYECVCPPGYTGKVCTENINECDPTPCSNGSTCIDGINEFTCICLPGLTGKLCHVNIDDCESSPCLNGARCVDGLNSYSCNCNNTGFTGKYCEININDCIGNPCVNGGQCIDDVKDYHCQCFPGYTGKNCEEDINECESSPCKNTGTCLEKSNATLYHPNIVATLNITLPESFQKPFDPTDAAGYECICVAGVTGRNCEININECESSPCLEGTCVDKIGGYVCECEEGFEGEHCEIDIDECQKFVPCKHGVCVDKQANYYCECDSDYGGKNCSVKLAGCIENPCSNNGTCKPYLLNETEHKFNCSCSNGFHGHTCEKITTMSLSGHSLVTVNTTRDEGYDIQFRFKTTLGDGLLALGKGLTYYILELSHGRLNLHSSLLNKWEGVFIGSNLNDSNWQRVFVAINSSHLVLSANDEQTIYPITFNENYNVTSTSFPTTYIGGIPSNLRKLTHGQPFLVGCLEDVLINGEWVLPELQNSSGMSFQDVEVGCHREPQCNPNPCHSGGHCTDKWRDFSCTCERPYLGHTCQYNYTAATFGYENTTNSLVTVTVADAARRAVRSIVDISMFIRTRQSRGQIFYLGSAFNPSSIAEETYIAAQLEGGELLVRIQFNATPEAYTVGGVKLNDGYNHLIEVIRNVTLVQVKLNGTEYFRKTISATGTLDAQVLFLGGQPQLRPVRQAVDGPSVITKADMTATTGSAAAVTTPLSMIHFKGIIQDVQISNGSKTMVVEFFPLNVEELDIPMSFGAVTFDNSTILEGVLSDDSCRINPCENHGSCVNTWNDYRCVCTKGFKGKDCKELEFCELRHCPKDSTCRNIQDGYECIANATFDGESPPLLYNFIHNFTENTAVLFDSIEIAYRTRSWGTVLFAKYLDNHFVIFIYHNEVIVEWNIGGDIQNRQFRKEHFEGQWITLYLELKEDTLKGGFKEMVKDDTPNFTVENFNSTYFTELFAKGTIFIAGSDNKTFNYRSLLDSEDYSNSTTYVTVVDTTTEFAFTSNAVELPENGFTTDTPWPLYRMDVNKTSDIFKGCLGEIRIGTLLVPFYVRTKLYSRDYYPHSYFGLSNISTGNIGCQLCYEADCFNAGQCIDPIDTYKCQCPAGFAADDCSVDINECENNQCQNNATCIDKIAKYECKCLPGYNGNFCENDIDECTSNPCHHGGTCFDLLATFKCECPEEYVGKQCEALRLITCENQPCKEGATCQDGKNFETGNNFTCICTEGYVGPLCDTPFCLRQHCEAGYCNTTEQQPICQCQRGYEGKYCEVNIDDCDLPSGDPCKNGGICIDGINRYDCNCTGIGYTGLLCEMDINECEQITDVCGVDGKCKNLPGTYTCECPRGSCGFGCEVYDPCQRDPCDHGKCEPSCTDIPDYICECDESWVGKNCTLTKLESAEEPEGVNILYIIIPIVVVILLGLMIGAAILVNMARSKRATRGTYSPSAQEFCNPRVELDHVLKPPPEERLI